MFGLCSGGTLDWTIGTRAKLKNFLLEKDFWMAQTIVRFESMNYVFAERLEVADTYQDNDKHLIGQSMVAIHLELEPDRPTARKVISLEHARELRDDLIRILGEYDGTSDT